MPIAPQILAIIALLVATYVGLLAFGPARARLLYSKEEKAAWDSLIQQRLGNWLTLTNIVGTLTSFATVFVFFIGNTPVFGWVLAICPLSIWLGAYVTNGLTRRITALPVVSAMLDSPDQTGGVIASLFWRNNPSAKRVAYTIKWLSICNIMGVIWLEFALVADIGGPFLGFDTLVGRSAFLLFMALSVFYFVLRFGIRGFVFADIFQTPLLALATLLLGIGAIAALSGAATTTTLSSLRIALTPLADPKTLILFTLHVLFLNAFFVVVTEPHWLRVWIFRDKETKLQPRSALATAVVWLLLIALGISARVLVGDQIGPAALGGLVERVSSISPLFLMAFWFAGIAALFTTADANIYSFLVVRGFQAKAGKLQQQSLEKLRPVSSAFVASAVFGVVYYAVRYFEVPIEKLIFLIIPLGLNGLPGLVQLALGKEARLLPIVVSLTGYVSCGVIGLVQPQQELFWTLAAAAVPAIVSGAVWLRGRTGER